MSHVSSRRDPVGRARAGLRPARPADAAELPVELADPAKLPPPPPLNLAGTRAPATAVLGPLGIRPEAIGEILGADAGSLAARIEDSAQLSSLVAAYWPDQIVSADSPAVDDDPFTAFVCPAVSVAREQLARELSSSSAVQLREAAAAISGSMASFLRVKLRRQALRVLALKAADLGAAGREADLGRLAADPGFRQEVFEEFPVLARLLCDTADRFLSASRVLLDRLASDLDLVAGLAGLSPGDAALTGIQTGLGDLHRGGQSVAAIIFADGKRVIYKPRSLLAESQLATFARELLHDSGLPSLRFANIIDRGDYGWCQEVSPAPCGTPNDVATFYFRCGMLLALLHIIGVTDIHEGNIIAAGADPVVVDFETVLDPHTKEAANPLSGIGMLPKSLVERGYSDSAGVSELDISGICGRVSAARRTPRPLLSVDSDPAGVPRLVRGYREVPLSDNVPQLNGSPVAGDGYISEIQDGFSAMHKRMLSMATLCEGFIRRVEGSPVRIVLRDTSVYSRLLDESTHPDLMRDGLDRSLFLAAVAAQDPGGVSGAISRSEISQLLRGDIPYFEARADAVHLSDDAGVRQDEFFITSGAEMARQRLRRSTLAGLPDLVKAIEKSFKSAGE